MDISFLMKIMGVGMTVAVTCQILSKIGRDEQVSMVSVAGIIVVFLMLLGEIGTVFDSIREVFGL